MAEIKMLDAAQAYGQALKKAGKGDGPDLAGGAGETSTFKAALTDVINDAVSTTAGAETTSMQAVAREAELVDVVTSVANAELVVETVVAVRDKVIQAYNDIIRMPI